MRGPYRDTKAARLSTVTGDEVELYFVGVARRVRDRRIELGLDQWQLAERSGICQTAINRIEQASSQRGRWKSGPMLLTIVLLARALGVNPSELLP